MFIFTKISAMKHTFLFTLLLVFCISVFADAGFGKIRRLHGASVFTFRGGTQLKNHILALSNHSFFKKDSTFEGDYSKLWQVEREPYIITTEEGGRRWDESDRDIYISLVDTTTGITTDSLKYFAKDYNIDFKISGISNGKLQFTSDSSKVVYQYTILDKDTEKAYHTNRIIFISCSVIGFVLLIVLFIRNKNKQSKTV